MGEGSCLGAKASWGWATDKGAACREVTRGCLRVLIYNASDINTYVHIIGWTTVLLSFHWGQLFTDLSSRALSVVNSAPADLPTIRPFRGIRRPSTRPADDHLLELGQR